MFGPGSFKEQRPGGIYSLLSGSECLNLCGPALILWLAYSVFITAESGLTFPLWVHRAVLCRDYRAGVGELYGGHHELIYIYLSVHQSHSVIKHLLLRYFLLLCRLPAEPHRVTFEVRAALCCCAQNKALRY